MARLCETTAELAGAQNLRALTFRGDARQRDEDSFDARCAHVLVEDARSGRLVGCYRLLPLAHAGQIDESYSAQFYGLSKLRQFKGPIMELGRFCILPGIRDPDVLRVAWAELTRLVDEMGITLLFGCSSFRGTDARPYGEAFELLGRRHLAPYRWRPQIKAATIFTFADACNRRMPDPNRALRRMPPLLRAYLGLGGWVSDHAVVDHDLDTLHVFTGVEIATIPASRKRLLRASVTRPMAPFRARRR